MEGPLFFLFGASWSTLIVTMRLFFSWRMVRTHVIQPHLKTLRCWPLWNVKRFKSNG
ncbi:hypothetical protein BJY00DRAFT_282334 [Aspergillus carlsbadensis]|nr:hypothetical protein BJY00DRAFT_282334 [Aspergillus carlsbadensis]